MGLLTNAPPTYRKSTAKRSLDQGVDDFSDDEAPATANPDVIMDDDDDEDEDDRHKSDADEIKEERLNAFMDDPEQSMKIFLGSYMREQGLIWYVFSSSMHTCI